MATWRTISRRITTTRGFSLMEVMIAMGIFVIGMVAIASIFPVAAVMQRETVRGVIAELVGENAASILEQQGIPKMDITSEYGLPPVNLYPGGDQAFDTDGKIYPLDPQMLGAPLGEEVNIDLRRWQQSLRSYPASVDLNERTYIWVPLIRDVNRDVNIFGNDAFEFNVFVFILRRHGEATYDKPASDWRGSITWANPDDPPSVPGVRSVVVTRSGSFTNRFNFEDPGFNRKDENCVEDCEIDQVVFGAQVLDNFGRVYVVRNADANGFDTDHDTILPDPDSGEWPIAVWYAPVGSAGRSSPALLVEGPLAEVVKP